MKLDHSAPTDNVSSARRKLVRGVFSAAAVVPLSGGATTATASSLRCLANAPQAINAPSDTLVVAVKRWNITVSGSTIRLVRVSDLTSQGTIFGFNTSNYLSSGGRAGAVWIKYADGTPYVPPSGQQPAVDNANWVALRFENAGTGNVVNMRLTGLARSTSNLSGTGKVVHKSCWSSFKPS